MMHQKPRVLFLDATNSDRSQIAEALFRLRAGEMFEVCSAGLKPEPIRILDAERKRPIRPVAVTAADGRPLGMFTRRRQADDRSLIRGGHRSDM
jgi:protein-tyrosine-phosphatase